MAPKLKKGFQERYHALLQHFGTTDFTKEEVSKFLEELKGDSEAMVNQTIHELSKAGLLNVKSDPNDKRRKIYSLSSLSSVEADTGEVTRDKLETLLKKAADLIRTRVDYNFILVLLFLKRVSDVWEQEFKKVEQELLDKGFPEELAKEEARRPEHHKFSYDPELLWNNLRAEPQRLPEKLSMALKRLGDLNPEIAPVVASADFLAFTSHQENLELLRQLAELFSAYDLSKAAPDALGDAYEWLINKFAPTKAKEGEVYTPREVIRLMVELLNPLPDGEISVYDPACGSGGMLIGTYHYVKEKYGKDVADRKLSLYGQEANPKSQALGILNLQIHDIRDANIALGDTLINPKFVGEKKFNFVIANPPWSQDGYGEETLKKAKLPDRYVYGYPPNDKADWAWIQHMLYSAKEDGKVAVVLDNGVLFRGGKEKAVRSRIVKDDLLEALVLLPEKLFYNTLAAGVILIFNKAKPKERKGKVLFINASELYQKHESVRRLNQLSKDNIAKIVSLYKEWKEEEGVAKIIDFEKIENNDFDLNVTRYVWKKEEQEDIDVVSEYNELKQIEEQGKAEQLKFEGYLREVYG